MYASAACHHKKVTDRLLYLLSSYLNKKMAVMLCNVILYYNIFDVLFPLFQRDGISKYNKIYHFDYMLNNQKVHMVMTSVSGHLLNYEFVAAYRGW